MWERSLFYISFFLICFHAYTNIMNNKKRGLKSFQSYCVLVRYYSAIILHELNIMVKSHSNTESRLHDIWKRWLKMSKLLKDGDMLFSYERIKCQGQCLRHPIYTHQARGGQVQVCNCHVWFFQVRVCNCHVWFFQVRVCNGHVWFFQVRDRNIYIAF